MTEIYMRRIAQHLPLVTDLAEKYAGRGVPLLDLVHAGNLGLIQAARMYMHKPDEVFPSLANWEIRRQMNRELRKLDEPE